MKYHIYRGFKGECESIPLGDALATLTDEQFVTFLSMIKYKVLEAYTSMGRYLIEVDPGVTLYIEVE